MDKKVLKKIRAAVYNVISVQLCFPIFEAHGLNLCDEPTCDPKTCPVVQAIMEDLKNGK